MFPSKEPPVPPTAASTTANALATTGASVNVSNAAPPVVGQELIAASSVTTIWKNPLALNALLFDNGVLTDAEIIQAAIDKASELGINAIVIPEKDSSNSAWSLDEAILLPSNMVVYLKNCYLKLSDTCRDNFFRSDNIGYGITSFVVNTNIHIIGSGNPVLEGANNPRSTGDANKILSLTPSVGWSTQSFGTDTGVVGEMQNGDWRNYSVYFGYVDTFSIIGLTLRDFHSWGIVPERSGNGIIQDITYIATGSINGRGVRNQTGLQTQLGCYNLTIKGSYGYADDDVVAVVSLLLGGYYSIFTAGTYGTYGVTGMTDRGGVLDDQYNITVEDVNAYTGIGSLVRLLDLNGLKLYNISVNNIKTSLAPSIGSGATIRIGEHIGYGGSTYGNLHDVTISNVISDDDDVIYVDGGLVRCAVSNIIKKSTVNAHSAYYETPTFLGSANVKTNNLIPS